MCLLKNHLAAKKIGRDVVNGSILLLHVLFAGMMRVPGDTACRHGAPAVTGLALVPRAVSGCWCAAELEPMLIHDPLVSVRPSVTAFYHK